MWGTSKVTKFVISMSDSAKIYAKSKINVDNIVYKVSLKLSLCRAVSLAAVKV